MANTRIKEFFNSRFFEIPKYQRGYAWEKKNIRELFEDIQEAIEVKASHYIGTIVLSRTEKNDVFYVVDGQQRITTITMIINALISKMSNEDAIFYRRFYIKHNDNYRLIPLGRENEFFKDLMENGTADLKPINRSQRLLIDAYQEITDMLEHILKTTIPTEYLENIENLQIMEFVEDSEGDAIRIFQTVNDRGKPLTNMEKAKSLLVYFSNRYLNGKLDSQINNDFGKMFEIYDQIKHTGQLNNIDLISGRYGEFNEDNIMRYHFVIFSTEDYDPTANYVLEYLKRELKKYRKNDESKVQIQEFIENYVESLLDFFESLNELIQKTSVDKKYYKIFSILGLSATLYPLVTILNSQNRLPKNLQAENFDRHTFLDLVEIIDVRVYKIRGTDPKADMARFAFDVKNANRSDWDVEQWLHWFNSRWMNENEFRNNLLGSIYKRSRAVLPHILLDYSEHLSNTELDLETLKDYVKIKALSIEHILSQKPKFTLKTHGFKSNDEYLDFEHTLGNLTLLEKSLNSSVNNKNVYDKVTFYDRSKFKMTKALATKITHDGQFKKSDIEKRSEKIAEYLESKWWC
ncbi:MAG: hypothetical protein CMC13_06710 [Flavobacteriaceae bacterium]|nr:hypothetical protein [Flavobacteriaceae bacterium]|tara:strand:+ start:2386 stop:4116 length:1731 start_codon:yes stop_codon:yes gene_type:complete